MLARHGPAAVEARPGIDLTVEFGMLFSQEFVAGIDDGRLRPLRTGIGQEVLDMGPHAELGRSEAGAGHPVPRRAEAAEIVLVRRYVATIGKVARFLQGLAKGHVRPDAFAAGFVIIGLDDVFQGRVQFGVRIALTDEMDHLAGRYRCRSQDSIGPLGDVEHGPAIGPGQLPVCLLQARVSARRASPVAWTGAGTRPGSRQRLATRLPQRGLFPSYKAWYVPCFRFSSVILEI